MDVVGVVATVIGVGIAAVALWFQIRGHNASSPVAAPDMGHKAAVTVSVANSFPTFANGDVGDWYVTVKAYNGGDRRVTVDAWGFELPGGGSLFQIRQVAWSPDLPYKLEPGDKVEFWMP